MSHAASTVPYVGDLVHVRPGSTTPDSGHPSTPRSRCANLARLIVTLQTCRFRSTSKFYLVNPLAQPNYLVNPLWTDLTNAAAFQAFRPSLEGRSRSSRRPVTRRDDAELSWLSLGEVSTGWHCAPRATKSSGGHASRCLWSLVHGANGVEPGPFRVRVLRRRFLRFVYDTREALRG